MSAVQDRIAPLAASYGGGNLLNLIASFENASGGSSAFANADGLDAAALAEQQHIVLLLLDGMGDRLLQRYARIDGFFNRHRKGALSSVFPTTTSAAISALMTGHPPGQHGVLAWHMHLASGLFTTLLWRHRQQTGQSAPRESEVFKAEPLFNRIHRDSYQVQPHFLVDSPFSRRHRGRARAYGAQNFNELLGQINHISQGPKPTFSYVYWPELDSLGHKHGVASREWRDALNRIERSIEQLTHKLQGRPVTLVITADHGMVDAHGGQCANIADLPDLHACLDAPLAGEPRAAFCRVKTERLDEFDALCRERYADILHALPVADAFQRGLFGPDPDHSLEPRAGDRLLLMQDKHTLVEVLPGETLPAMVGVHGGLHPDEIAIPLITVDTA